MDALKAGWFSEMNSKWWPNECFSLEVEEILYREKSKYQDILVFKSKAYGNVLVLDGIIQCTERDEFAYHEMMAHVPLFAHSDPKSVLIVGGGDGGTLREVVKHSCVQEVVLCEIDECVIEMSKKYFPTLSCKFDSPKVTVLVQDAIQYVKDCAGTRKFDIVIMDISDPLDEGPSKLLFSKAFQENVSAILNDDGIMCHQDDSGWLDPASLTEHISSCQEVFPVVEFGNMQVPSYPSGSLGFIIASKHQDKRPSLPHRTLTPAQVKEMGLHYYNTDIHKAAFVVPQFIIEMLN